MTYQIVSDLHIEYKNDDNLDPLDFITPKADILILAGDIGSLYKFKQLKTFLEQICPHFKATIYVPGNHEFYLQDGYKPQSFDNLNVQFHSLQQQVKKLYILQQASIIINNICFVGCTLWSKCLINIPRYIVRIPDMNTLTYLQKHESDVNFLKKMITWNNNMKNSGQNEYKKLVVITHHCPTEKVLSANTKKDKFKSLYVSDLEYLITNESIHTWICGHIHQNFDFRLKGTRIVGNQKGKPKDKICDFSKEFLIDFD